MREYGPDDLVDEATSARQVELRAAALLLADAWKVLTSLPELHRNIAEATIGLFAKKV